MCNYRHRILLRRQGQIQGYNVATGCQQTFSYIWTKTLIRLMVRFTFARFSVPQHSNLHGHSRNRATSESIHSHGLQGDQSCSYRGRATSQAGVEGRRGTWLLPEYSSSSSGFRAESNFWVNRFRDYQPFFSLKSYKLSKIWLSKTTTRFC